MARRPLLPWVTLTTVLALSLTWLFVAEASARPPAAELTSVSSATTGRSLVPGAEPTATLVATIAPAGVAGSVTPGAARTLEVPGGWHGAPSILPVIAEQPGLVKVRLAQRPNGSTAWVPTSAVRLASDPYHIVVDLATTHLVLFDHGRQVADFPVGVGTSTYPTPTGQFFVAFLAAPPAPAYGAFVIVTSAHSNTITDWDRTGDAITGIHGPLGSDAAIGTRGARVSKGCVRLHEADLLRLRPVPAGTPVDIVG